ncbi:MAG: hypothetical protein GYA16_11300 [Spirochaetes bacterium]|nr:hypothetical protein [Spirochaetota bacterium]
MQIHFHNQKWLKAFHVLFVIMWVGGAITLSSKQFFINAASDSELYGILSTLHYIDIFIIIPGAMGCLITGILYSSLTNWGWFTYKWIIVKWIICLYGVIFGTYPLGPWLENLVDIAKVQGLASYNDLQFIHSLTMSRLFGTFQALTLVFACFISSLKPWGKLKKLKI